MALPFVVILCLCGVFCLAPVALYLAWLGSVNRRPQPTVIGGGWDFAALLAGLSGFVVFGGGVLVAGLQSNFRYAARGNWERLRDAWGDEGLVWGMIALAYLLVVSGGVCLVLLSRLRTLVVYNIDRERAEAAVGEALADAGLNATRFGDVWADGRGLVSIDVFNGLRNVSVKVLPSDPRLAEELLRGLRQRLGAAPPADSPVGAWLTSAGLCCFVTVFCCILLIAYFLYLTTR